MSNCLFPELIYNRSGALFSDDRKYRYALWRIWNPEMPFILFIGLNPSTANETNNDATIRRVIEFAKSWNYGGIHMCNLFAYVTPYPIELKRCGNAVMDNDKHLKHYATQCKDVLFGWGNFKEAEERAKIVSSWFTDALCLGKNKNGTPKHPLYISSTTKPIKF
jgi:hypothetical protein